MTGYLSEVSVISKCTEHGESGEIIEYMKLSLVMDEEPKQRSYWLQLELHGSMIICHSSCNQED